MRVDAGWALGGFGIIFAVAVASCTPQVEVSTNRKVGPNGGKIELAGATLEIPAGALDKEVAITLNKLKGGVPKDYSAVSAVYELQPAGLSFALPARMTLEVSGGSGIPSVFLSAKDGKGYEKLAGLVQGQKVSAGISHFSTVFAGQGSGRAGELAFDEYEAALDAAACHDGAVCGEVFSESYCTRALAHAATVAGSKLEPRRRSIAQGRMVYDGAAARRCIDALMAVESCSQDERVGFGNADCEAVFAGKVAEGGICTIRADCSPGTFCTFEASLCPGICKAAKNVGDVVGYADDCLDGLHLYGGGCLAPVPEGGDCSPVQPSTRTRPCVGGLYCDGVTLKCTVRKPEGSACLSHQDCVRGYQCVGSSAVGKCTRLGSATESCALDTATGATCRLDLTCMQVDAASSTGKCKVPDLPAGPCFQHDNCEAGTYCDASGVTVGKCVPQKEAGGECGVPEHCAPGLYCKFTVGVGTGTCTPRTPDGQPCKTGQECSPSSICPGAVGLGDGGVSLCAPEACTLP